MNYNPEDWGLPAEPIPSFIGTTAAPVAAAYDAMGGDQGTEDFLRYALAPAPLPTQGYQGLSTGQQVGIPPLAPDIAQNYDAQYAGPSDTSNSFYTDDSGLNRPFDLSGLFAQRSGELGYDVPTYTPPQYGAPTYEYGEGTTTTMPDSLRLAQQNALSQSGALPEQEQQALYRNILGETGGNAPSFGNALSTAGNLALKGLSAVQQVQNTRAPGGAMFVTPTGTMGGTTDYWKAAQLPSDQAKAGALGLIGDNAVGRAVGDTLDVALDPRSLALAYLAGPGVLANVLGRGSMRMAPYVTSSLAAQGGTELAQELGAPGAVQIAAAVPAAVLGAYAPAAAGLATGLAAQGVKQGAIEVAARTATSARMNSLLSPDILTNARLAAMNAGRQGMDPLQAARDAITGSSVFKVAGAAEPTPEELEIVARMVASLDLPEGSVREAVLGSPRAYAQWTPEENAMIRELKQRGWGDQAIATGMGRAKASDITQQWQKILLSEGMQPVAGLEDVPVVEGYGGGVTPRASTIDVPTGQQNQQAFGDFVQQAAANPQIENPAVMGPLLGAGPHPGGPVSGALSPEAEAARYNIGPVPENQGRLIADVGPANLNIPASKPLTATERAQAARAGLGELGAAPEAPAGKGLGTPLQDIANANRTAASGFDISYLFRQGKALMRHVGAWWRGVTDGASAAFDGDKALALNAEMKANKRAKEAGVFFSDLPGEGKSGLTKREEDYADSFISGLPGYKQTGQANVVFLNRLRLDSFEQVTSMWDRAKIAVEAGTANPYQKAVARLARPGDEKALARYITRATGRGTLGPLEGSEIEGILGLTMFSARYQASIIQAPMNMFNFKNPLVAAEAFKDYFANYGSTIALLALADASGVADVELDPKSSDFGKFKIGNTRIDPWAGYQQLSTLTARMLSGTYADGRSITEGGPVEDRLKLLENFGRSKASPAFGTVYDLTRGGGKDPMGNKIGWDSLATSVLPIYMQSLYEASQEGLLGAAAMTLPAQFFGISADTYLPSEAQQLASAANKLSPRIPFENMGPNEQQEFIKAHPELQKYADAAKGNRSDLGKASDVTRAARQAEQDQRENAFLAGENLKSLPEEWAGFSREAMGARTQLAEDFKSAFGNFSRDDFDKVVDGYYGIGKRPDGTDDPAFEMPDGSPNWDKLQAARDSYLNSLKQAPDKEGELSQIEYMMDYLAYVQSRKSVFEQDYEGVQSELEAKGFYDITDPALKTAFWQQNPILEASYDFWQRYKGAPEASLSSIEAAEAFMLLQAQYGTKWQIKLTDTTIGSVPKGETGVAAGALEEAQRIIAFNQQNGTNIEAKIVNFSVPVNEKPEAWQAGGQIVMDYINIPGKERPDQLKNPELDAWLFYLGYSGVIQSVAALNFYRQLETRYGAGRAVETAKDMK